MLLAYHRSDGSLVWETDLGSIVNTSPVVSGDFVYVGTLRKILYGLKLSDGEIVSRQDVEGRIKTSPAIGYGRLFVATDEKLVLAFTGRGSK